MPASHLAERSRAALVAMAVAGGLGLGSACVDKTPIDPATCQVSAPVPYAGSVVIPTENVAEPGPYTWKNVAIAGGGFVTGIVVSPVLPGLVFARTDVGGAYRFNAETARWTAVTDWVGHDESNLTGVESIAVDPVEPSRVYIAAGQYLTAGNGSILISEDMGQTWSRVPISAPMGGNHDGRSMGERLAVDPNLPSVLYFASRTAGLWRSTDAGRTWTAVGGFPTTGASAANGNPGSGLTLVTFDPSSGAPGYPTPAIYVGVGVTNGPALFRSLDAGQTWEAVAGQPDGMMPHHAVLDRCGNLYLAYNDGPGPNNIAHGAVWRYNMAGGTWKDVSPPHRGGGFGGLAADAAHPGTMVVTTIDLWSPDEIYRTVDGGATWKALGGSAQRDAGGAEWLWWHGGSLTATGWMGDVEIDPFNPDRAYYITGQGVWSTDDLTAADAGAGTHWTFSNDGLEETVALDLISLPEGAPLLSGVGDIGGFRHDDLDVSPPDGMYANPIFGNTTGLDFAEAAPNIVARVGTSSGNSTVRGAYSIDGGATWTGFAGAPAGSTGSGTIAVSSDGATFVWAPQRGTPSFSRDNGATWTACAGVGQGVRVASDRVNAAKFYASSRTGMFVSTDGGATFTAAGGAVSGRPRPVFGIEGDVWVPTSTGLLHSVDSSATFTAIPQVNAATAVSFGAPAPGQPYPAVYLAGSVATVWGTYRSIDAGVTWERIDDPQHQFGYLNCLAGDRRQYGRVYLGTGGRGVVYGDPQ